MMYWPQPYELEFYASKNSVKLGCDLIEAPILSVDRCWQYSMPDEYISHQKSYHYDEIDQTARAHLLKNPDRLEAPEIRMLGNSHITFFGGQHVFALVREMADLGYIETMPFAVPPWEVEKFRYYFLKEQPPPYVEGPVLSLIGESHE